MTETVRFNKKKDVGLESFEQISKNLEGGKAIIRLIDYERLSHYSRRIIQRVRNKKPVDKMLSRLKHGIALAEKKSFIPVIEKINVSYPEQLPVSQRHEEIKQLIEKNQVVIVCGSTGSGKTTQLPKIALEAGCGRLGRIGCTQPRRLAATSVCNRVADELKLQRGHEVGYKVRFDDNTKSETVIKFMTDGILLAESVSDNRLLQYDTLIIDEAHERSLNIDFILGFLKVLLPKRPDLKIIISSATLDAEKFSQFFNDAPVVEVEGRTYPVDKFFLPPNEDEALDSHVCRAVKWIDEIDKSGDILIFLPGERDIRECSELLVRKTCAILKFCRFSRDFPLVNNNLFLILEVEEELFLLLMLLRLL